MKFYNRQKELELLARNLEQSKKMEKCFRYRKKVIFLQ
jgi:hypothetical protein